MDCSACSECAGPGFKAGTGASAAPFIFNKATGTITALAKDVSEAEIPAQIGGIAVTNIAELAVYDIKSSLTDLIIPASVKNIEKIAFARAKALKSVTFLGDAPTIGSKAFPEGVTIYYYAGKAGWTTPTWNGYHTEAIGNALSITTTTLPDGKVGVPYSVQLAATGENVEWYLYQASLPAGLTLSKTGLLSGTPTTAGQMHINVVAENSNGRDMASYDFKIVGENTPAFTDVPASAYYAPAVSWAVAHDPQITAGTSATTFSPNKPCTRAQAVTFLWRAAGEPEPATSKNPFKDVKQGQYYYKAVLWAVEKNITTGTSATTFSPNDACTRGQIVTFLYRFENKPAVTGSNPFQDVKKGQYFYDAVLWAAKKNITAGTSSTTFSPDTTCTRAQIVTFLYRDVG